MSRSRAAIGAELVPLVLILAGLAGSTALIVSAHRRAAPRPKVDAPIAIIATPRPATTPRPSPIVEAPPEVEPEPPAPPPLPDPTPSALAKLTSAEAEQLLEASRADRKAAAIEAAREAEEAESARYRRRQSLVHGQLGALDEKARRLEAEADALALERDALEREVNARKAAVARAKSRPGRAILPHKGPNGTWRRPIVVECRNGMAILQPRGIEFGLMDLESGFGPSSNPFVAAVAREAIRIQGKTSPDGQSVVPYIFFIVRPDGIRPYYEARGRLEPLGITFGYELADQAWEIDIPDLDDVAAWDGSAVDRAERPALARPSPRLSGGSPGEDDDLPSAWSTTRRAGSQGTFGGESSRAPQPRFFGGNGPWTDLRGRNDDSPTPKSGSGGLAGRGDPAGYPGDVLPRRDGGGADRPSTESAARPTRTWGDVAPDGGPGGGSPPRSSIGIEGSLDQSRGLAQGGGPRGGSDGSGPEVRADGVAASQMPTGGSGSDAGIPRLGDRSNPGDDPGNAFVWPRSDAGAKGSDRPAPSIIGGDDPSVAGSTIGDPSLIASGSIEEKDSASTRPADPGEQGSPVAAIQRPETGIRPALRRRGG